MKLEIFRYAAVPVKMNVKKNDTVVILTDSKVDSQIQDGLVTAVHNQQAIPILVMIPPLASFGNEPPAVAASAVLKADLIIAACSTAITHTNAIREALQNGVRYLAMGGITVNSLITGAATADYQEVTDISEKISADLDVCNQVHVTSANGSDIRFSLKGRPSFPLTGIIAERRGIAAFPDGEVACAPLEGTANGTIVVDGSMHHVGRISTPIRLKVEKGYVVEISGGDEAERLLKFLNEKGDEYSFNLAEFAIGTNREARLGDNSQESKKMLGTIHFAIGDNQTLGGNTYSKTHLDGLLMKPCVWLDGKQVINEGKLTEW
ncbi:aminopeptidase [Virgibacillus sp. DJP39]|uniref:aminopeptidase n=1 Tax=Virgibacillus sp. DJP39 TaxID=3409790 RepID=UPI003BB80066